MTGIGRDFRGHFGVGAQKLTVFDGFRGVGLRRARARERDNREISYIFAVLLQNRAQTTMVSNTL